MPLALLEHVNLNITDVDAARAFYITSLGAVENPVSTNERQLHINVGASQFHLLRKYSPAPPAQPRAVGASQIWSGHIELWTIEDLERVRDRILTEAPSPYQPTRELARITADSAGQLLECMCPFGNRFVVRRSPDGITSDTEGSHPGGSGTLICLTRAVHKVQKGAAARLADFWGSTLGAEVNVTTNTPRGGVPSACCCTVWFSSGQQLVFEECDDAPPFDAYERGEASAYHIAIYLETVRDFEEAFERCELAGLLYSNPVFASSPPQFGNAATRAEALACGQFRIKRLGAPRAGSGDSALVLEVEVRSVAHVSCPLSRKDRLAGGAPLETAPAFATWPPLPPLPFAERGIPRATGTFGEAAVVLASTRRSKRSDVQDVPDLHGLSDESSPTAAVGLHEDEVCEHADFEEQRVKRQRPNAQ